MSTSADKSPHDDRDSGLTRGERLNNERDLNREAELNREGELRRDRNQGRDAVPDGEASAERAQHRADTPSDRVAERDRESVVAREKHIYGGMKIGSAFFGWLTATGMGVVLTALVAAAGTAVGLSTGVNPDEVTQSLNQDPQTVGMVGIIVLGVIVLVAYYCGGYVAGRMARFDGMKQGLAVWLWALVIAIVVALLGWIGGSQFNVLAQVNSFPRIPVNEGDLTTAGIIAAVVVAVVALVGALLGGLAGMRFHRKVDKAGLDVV
ncbi:hypothetical protein [Glutamicibacter sp. BSL13]